MTLREFADAMLADNRLVLRPLDCGGMFRDLCMETVLYRDGPWQVELVAILPNVTVPKHRHLRAASLDFRLSGGGVAEVAGRRITGVSNGRERQTRRQYIRVPMGAWHGGTANPDGFTYLSFQRWDGEPTLISKDWEEHG